MYLGLDIGGSKTLLAVFDLAGKITYKAQFPTPEDYEDFLDELGDQINKIPDSNRINSCCVAAPGRIDRKRGIAEKFGNLGWHNVPLADDVGKMINLGHVLVENDAKLAGLSEALLLHKKYSKVLYLTISTGIGDGIIIDGKIDPDLSDSEAGHMVIKVDGKFKKWEDVASGRALFKKYGKKASEIEDAKIWRDYVIWLALGIDSLVATLQPDVVIIGGGVGAHYEKFGPYLEAELKKFENDMVKMPPMLKAQRPEEAVVFGCYEFIKQNA